MIFSSKQKHLENDFKLYFSINDPIKLEYRGIYHSSRVEDVLENSLLIAWPAVYGVLMKHKEGESIVIISSVRSGMHGYRAEILKKVDGSHSMFEVAPREYLGKIQRRNFARVPDMFTVHFRITEPKSRRGNEMIETISKNISANGMLLAVDKDHRPMAGDLLELAFNLPGSDIAIRTHALVIRVDTIEQPGASNVYEIAVHFTDIRKQEQSLIVKRVFLRQTELHKSGLL